MNLREIREECWVLARDTALTDSDRLWPEKEMNRYINRIYRYIARETQCIKDSSSPEVALLDIPVVDYTTLTAGTLDYIWANEAGNWLYQKDITPYLVALHPSILQIDEVKWMSQPWRLRKVSASKWKTNVWWERVIGSYATEYATDLQTGMIALNFRMETADKVQLCVRRLPLVDLINDDDIPEFRTHYHDFMINGIMMHMYRKRDAETLDTDKADGFEMAFNSDVDEIKQQESQLEDFLRPNEAMEAFR
jgi:hypothetical protein